MSSLSVNTITDANGGTTATINGYTPTVSNMAGRNRIINGAMMIDQRNAGASVANPQSGEYTVDRWQILRSQASKLSVQQNAGSVTPPVGFTSYLGITSSSAYSVLSSDYFLLGHKIEGFNIADLNWGTVSAQTVTLSFWVRSSLTGTFGGALNNSTGTRSYPFSYTINVADTWEQKTITIGGDTSGTWLTTNATGVSVRFGLGLGSTYSTTAGAWASGAYYSATGAVSVVGTSGATFYITGVQLEKGSTATSFDYRPYGTELALCQRYYETITTSAFGVTLASGAWGASNNYAAWKFAVNKRAAATVAKTASAAWNGTTPAIFGGISECYFSGGATAFYLICASGTDAIYASAEL